MLLVVYVWYMVLVADLFQPVHGLASEPLLNGDVRHCCSCLLHRATASHPAQTRSRLLVELARRTPHAFSNQVALKLGECPEQVKDELFPLVVVSMFS